MINKDKHIIEENIPLFPLGIVVLPGETRFLHIFEQRYKNLFEDIDKADGCFGIPFIRKRMKNTGRPISWRTLLIKCGSFLRKLWFMRTG